MSETGLYALYGLPLTSNKPYKKVEINDFILQMKKFDMQVNYLG